MYHYLLLTERTTALWAVYGHFLSSQSSLFKHSMIKLLSYLQVRDYTNHVIVIPRALTLQDDWLGSGV